MAKKPAAMKAPKKDAPPKGESSKFWLNEISQAGKREETWERRAQKVVDRYRDERDKTAGGERRTNILWSNTEILKSVLFQKVGNPDVRRRFPKKGSDEGKARTAALVLERSLSYCVDDYDADYHIECAVEDYLLPGRGQAWIRYDAEIEEAPKSEEDDAAEDAAEGETEGDDEESDTEAVGISDQTVRLEHVYWKDYRTSAGRKETDIWWKARRHQYSLAELKQYFPAHAAYVPMDSQIEGSPKELSQKEASSRADVWEIWDKSKRRRLYVAEGYPYILKSDDDPYKLREFFPCPSALYGVKTTSSLTPVPEYLLYQDQCEELDAITTRLNRLIDALKRRGVYDASIDGAENQLAQLAYADDNEFLPYKGMAVLMEKGGLKNVFQTEDLAPIIQVVQELYAQRSMLIQTIYEVTGISDVVRGSSNPNETATAQRIKGQFGSLRITNRQARVNKFIRDCYRLKAEIIAEHFTREKLVEMTGIDMPLQIEIDGAKQQLAMLQQMQQAQQQPQLPAPGAPQMPPQQAMPAMPPPDPELIAHLQATAKAISWEDISGILRSDSRRGYKIDIETEDTTQFDEDLEKQRRIEFLTTMQPVIQGALQLSQVAPEMLPLAKETVLFALKGFKVGRQLEETFEDAFGKLEGRPPQPAPPDPEQQRLEIEGKKADAEIELKKQSAAVDIEGKRIDHQLKQADLAMKQAELEAKQKEIALGIMQERMNMQSQAIEQERASESHAMAMEGMRAGQQMKAQDANMKANRMVETAKESASIGKVIKQLVLEMGELRKSHDNLASTLTGAPISH